MKKRLYLYFFFALLILQIHGFSQTDYEFWFAAPAVTHQFVSPSPVLYQNLNRPIRLYFTTAEISATVVIDQPANASFIPIQVNVNNITATVVDLTGFIDLIENSPADSILNHGLHITSTSRITAFYEVQSPFNAETWDLLGRNALGYEFIIPAQNHFNNYQYSDPPARNSFSIVATEDSTIVTIDPKKTIEGHSASDTFSVMLNQGQTWCGRAVSGDSLSHLGGSFVFSNKPVAVTMCDDALYIPSSHPYSIDIAGCQLIPRHIAGTEFILNAQNIQPDPDRLFVYAFNDSTHITFNDSVEILQRTINRGESTELINSSVDNFTGYTIESINSDKPVMVYQFTIMDHNFPYPFSGKAPQAASSLVPPIACGGSRRVCFATTPPRGKLPFFNLNIFTHNGNQGSFQCIPPTITFPPSNFFPVAGTNGEWVMGGGSFIGFPIGTTIIITNSKGRFEVSALSSSESADTASYSKFAYFTDFSKLNLGPDRSICPGDSTLLDAGYGRDSYLWNTGDTTSTIWVKIPGTYWVSTIEDGNCNLSDTINISNYFNTPVNLGPDRQICDGDSIFLNAGSGRAWYCWSTGDSTQTIWVKSSGIYWVRVPDVHCIVSDTVMVSITPPPEITNNPLSKSICSGESTNIPLTSNIPGAAFHWTATLNSGNITGFSADSGLIINQVLVNSLAIPGIVTYHITPKIGSCAGTTMDFPVTVNAGDSVKVSISASTNNICAGTPVTFTTTPTNGGIPTYQWKINGLTVGSNSPNYTYSPINGDIVSCILTSSLIVCISNNPATSNTIQMIVNPLNPVSVSISSFANPVCSGTNVTYIATPIHGGTTPFYQWKVNGVIVGTNNPNYSYAPVNGDIVTCILTSNILCPTGNPAISNPITMIVNPNLSVSVSISASANPFCQGSSVTFTAVPTNGGAAPSYQWKVNGINIGPNNTVYSYSPNNGDVVSCVLTSNIACPIGNPATSNSITMIVNANLPAGINIVASANPFCPGNSVTFTATPTNGGSTPAYQWKVNGVNAGTNSSIFTYNPISGDLVSCIMTSNLACVTANPATSNTITMSGTLAPIVTFMLCNDSITTTNAKPFKLKGGIPLGGAYSGAGVAGGIFNPAIAGVGNHQINYTYTNAALCSAIAHSFLHIFNPSNLPCGSPLTDIRDNKVYPTVQIGAQCWMAANLNYGAMIPGNTSQRDNCIWEKYCYNDVAANCGQQTYYQWDELMQYDETVSTQGLCPPGWHVSTEADWNTLFSNYISNGFAGNPLKYSGFSGFNAMLSGARHLNKNWDYQGFATFFWSSTTHGINKAWAHGMNDVDPSASLYPGLRSDAFSVRCLRDN